MWHVRVLTLGEDEELRNAGDSRAETVWYRNAMSQSSNPPGSQSPYGRWGALGTRASKEARPSYSGGAFPLSCSFSAIAPLIVKQRRWGQGIGSRKGWQEQGLSGGVSVWRG
jgi:hypothetical protein